MRYPIGILGISIFILYQLGITMKIKVSKLREVLKTQGLSENIVTDFIKFLIRKKKERELEKITNDTEYQAILKKYNIKPVDWDKNFTLDDLPAFRKK